MQTKGFVLMMCLLFGLLCSALALASLTFTVLSSQLNQAILQQQKQRLAALRQPAALPAASSAQNLDSCPPQFLIWPAGWQKCRLQRSEQQELQTQQSGQIKLHWQVDPLTQGGEI